ncbi:MAG: sulfite exporter TauE/SafE family protein [Phycisphaerae bacterium]
MDGTTFLIPAILFGATLIRSTFGFGEALIAVPLLALVLPVSTAAPLAVLASVTVAGIVVVQDHRHIHIKPAAGLLAASALGIPLGLLILREGNESVIKGVLGIFLIAFSGWSLLSKRKIHLRHDHLPLLLACGFVSGVTGGAYGMNGPPLVVYASLRQWSAQHFRATLQAYFLPASAIGLLGYYLSGLWTWEVTRAYLMSLPLVVVAVLVGRAINRRLEGHGFLRVIYVGLIGIGGLLLVQVIRRQYFHG